MPNEKKRILLVDDHPIAIEGLRALLSGTLDLELAGICPSVDSALAFLRTTAPDLIVMDISMEGSNGLVGTQLITTYLHIPILIYTCNDENIYAPMAMAAGAKGLVMKDQPDQEVLRAMRSVLQGHDYHSPRMAKYRDSTTIRPKDREPPRRPVKLTPKEREILNYLVDGFSTIRIAMALNVSLTTVETHRLNIRNKLGFDSQNALIRWAICQRAKGLEDKVRLPNIPPPPP